MGRPSVLMVGFGGLALVLLIVSGVVFYERPTVLKVAVSSTDAEDYDLMGAAAKVLKRGHYPIRLKLVPTDGVTAAASALDHGAADLAIVRADVAMPSSGETVVLLHKDIALMLAPFGSGIEKVSDLADKRIGILSQRLGDRNVLETTLAQYDIAPAGVKMVPLAAAGVADAIRSKSIDAVFAVGKVSDATMAGVVKSVTKAGDGAPIFIPVAEAAAIAQRSPAFESIEVVRGAFGGNPPRPTDDVDTLGITYRMVADADLSQGVVASVTRFLLSERVALAQLAPGARSIEAPSTDKGAPFPVHPGTAAYIDDEEETFLDRYSDLIYIGAMVLGVLASGMTAIMSRFGPQSSVRIEDLLSRLLLVFKQVRAAGTLGSLDDFEREVDEIVAAALDDACLRGLDERRVAALNMAVEQVRAAIRDRRENLGRAMFTPANDEARLTVEAASFRPIRTLSDRSAPSDA
ncbi:TAXI family TRAP transporter solute-binding subunit [Lichenihabitans psoromatis]|uniref:TAXI family TRAP transporter solute-binding subunit n=1 Tax=Lichenihabitans psoromatis TaxID=2528642 RepID=UPI00103850F1|nr:TAXI family TRAP transporter solute-binding subunit [Lichenihabitans psoromatis]